MNLITNFINSKNMQLFIVTLFTLIAGFKSEKSRNKMLELLSSPTWVINFIIVIIFIIYTYKTTKNGPNIKENKHTRESLKKALIAFLIAIFGEISLTIAPFWVIFSVAYYLDGWI